MNKSRETATSYCKPGWIRQILRKATQGHKSSYIHEIPPRCGGRCGRWQPKFINAWRTPVTPSALQLPAAPFKPTWEPCRGSTHFFFFFYGLCIPSVILRVHPLGFCFAHKKVLTSHWLCTCAIEKTLVEKSIHRENKWGCVCFFQSVPTMQLEKKVVSCLVKQRAKNAAFFRSIKLIKRFCSTKRLKIPD